jgi:putative ABC transport system permease protein
MNLLRLAFLLRAGLRLTLLGTVAGLLAGLGGARLIASRLYEISAYDPAVFIVVGGVVTLVAILAVLLPARRATRLDAIHALRTD